MNMRLTIYTIMAMLTLGIAGVRAQEIEIPEDAPRETWQLVYDDYGSIERNESQYKDHTLSVTVVRGENCLFVQGMAKSCPDSWVKLSITDDYLNNALLLWCNQPVSESGSTQYITTGNFSHDSGGTTSHIYCDIYGRSDKTPLILMRDFSSDQKVYRAKDKSGYWVADKPDRGFHQGYFLNIGDTDALRNWVWPEEEAYMNPRLIDTTGVPAGINASENDADAPVYTLSGIKVDRDHLTPGVYVSRGKKIVVR